MLSKRIIAVILLKDGRAVKTRQFGGPRDVGNPVSQARIYYANGIDELVILNLEPEKGVQPLLDVLKPISEQCFIPIAAGGGIRTVEDAAELIKTGSEKVVIRTAWEIIPDLADRFGSQSVTECVDYRRGETPFPSGEQAGEVIFQCIDNDGVMRGYDLKALQFWEKCPVPVVMLGGCGQYKHLLEAFQGGADACAAGSIWAFTDSNPLRAKAFLRNQGVVLRS